jgi:uncharacterized protein YndB with AHSA1/START domain
MLERQVFIPASPEHVWETLTDPDAISTWFGAEVDWDLSPGGRARFLEDDGAVRDGRVDVVIPDQHLRFSWWPEGQADDETSEVSYFLEPDGDGTDLTIIERPVPTKQPATTQSTDVLSGRACDSTAPTWTAMDDHMVGVWSRDNAPVAVGTR